MRSSLRRATVIMILLGVLFVPGLLQARTPASDWMRASRPVVESGFFSMVRNLLTDLFGDRVAGSPSGSGFAKTGGQLDPAGGPTSNSTTTPEGDTGGQLDPAGGPK
jgi:hypothetical protein